MLPKLLIAIVFAVVAGLATFRLLKPPTPVITTPIVNNPGPKLETYTGDKLGISFDYDASNTVYEDTEQAYSIRGNGDFRKNFTYYVRYEPPSFIAAVVLTNGGNLDEAQLTIWGFDNPENLSIDSWYQKYWYYPFMWGEFSSDRKNSIAPKSEASVSGHLASGNIVSYQEKSPVYTYVSAGNRMYLVRRFTNPEDKLATKAFDSLKIKAVQP